MSGVTFRDLRKREGLDVPKEEEFHMTGMSQIDRNQVFRYDLQETRPRLMRTSERGDRILGVLTVLFCGVLGALTHAAVQVFDGVHHLIIIADLVLVVLALAVWINSMRRPQEIEAETPFIPNGMRPN